MIADVQGFIDRYCDALAVARRGAEDSGVIRAGADVVRQIGCLAHRAEPDLTVGIGIRNARDEPVFGTNSRLLGVPIDVPAAQSFVVTLTVRVGLPAGHYRIALALHEGLTHQEGCYHWREEPVLSGNSTEPSSGPMVVPKQATEPRATADGTMRRVSRRRMSFDDVSCPASYCGQPRVSAIVAAP